MALVWVATAPIHFSGVLAFNPGNVVPDSVVTRFDLDTSGLVEQAEGSTPSGPNYGVNPVTQSEMDALVSGAGRLSDVALRAAYVSHQRPVIAGVPLFARGTSYTNGANATAGNGYVDQTAAALGSSATHNAGAGGSTTPALCAQYANGGANGWVPGTSTGLVTIEAGIGEALQEDDATWAGHRQVFENQLVTALRWHRASEMREGNHATISPGTASQESLTGFGALEAPHGLKLLGDGDSFSITLAETNDNVEIVLVMVPWKATADATNNGNYKFRVGSGGWQTGSTSGHGDPRPDGSNVLLTISSERLTGLARNATITVQKVGTGGQVWCRGYLVMGNPTPPPIVLVQDVPLVESGGQWTYTAAGLATGPRKNNATLNVYRQLIRDIVRRPEFSDGTVVIADPIARWDITSHISSDGVHPNDAGHAVYAGAVTNALACIGR